MLNGQQRNKTTTRRNHQRHTTKAKGPCVAGTLCGKRPREDPISKLGILHVLLVPVLVIERPSSPLVRSSLPQRRFYRRPGPISTAGSDVDRVLVEGQPARGSGGWGFSWPLRAAEAGCESVVRRSVGAPAGSVELRRAAKRLPVLPTTGADRCAGERSTGLCWSGQGAVECIGSARPSGTNCWAMQRMRGHRGIAGTIRWLLQSTSLEACEIYLSSDVPGLTLVAERRGRG